MARCLVLVILTGCQPGVVAAPGAFGAASRASVTVAQAMGHLRIRIKWPSRDLPNFEAQAIPLRTKCLRFTTWSAQDQVLDTRLVTRSEAGALIPLPAGTGYRMVAEAYSEAAPTAQSVPIAQGSATNLTIWKSKTTAVPLTLTATFAPTIARLDPAYGLPGKLVTLDGTGFGAVEALAFEVTFGGMRAEATRSNETRIVAKVPAALPVGRLVNVGVTVDGIPSDTIAPFLVDSAGITVDVVPGGLLPAHGLTIDFAAGASASAGGFGLTLR